MVGCTKNVSEDDANISAYASLAVQHLKRSMLDGLLLNSSHELARVEESSRRAAGMFRSGSWWRIKGRSDLALLILYCIIFSLYYIHRFTTRGLGVYDSSIDSSAFPADML